MYASSFAFAFSSLKYIFLLFDVKATANAFMNSLPLKGKKSVILCCLPLSSGKSSLLTRVAPACLAGEVLVSVLNIC